MDQDGKAHAAITIGNKQQVYSLKSKLFDSWLNQQYRRITNTLPSPSALQTLKAAMEADIITSGEVLPLSIRVSKHDDACWYDLGDKAVRIDEKGWSITDNPPTMFRRQEHQLPQVEPIMGGNILDVLKYVNLKDKKQQLMFLVTMVSSFVPNIPHPVVAIHGSKGSGKTSMQKIIRKIIDPSKAKPSTLSRKLDDLVLQLSKNYLTTYDNLDHLRGEQSDLLCQAVTGGCAEKRQLYSDDQVVTTNFQGIVTINGINLVASRGDLLERCVILELQRIEESGRLTEEDIWRNFERDLSGILGGIFSTFSEALKILPTITLPELPRMADFAKIGCAIAIALGYTQEEFMEAYKTNLRIANDNAVSNNPLAEALRIFMSDKESWAGTVGDLYRELLTIAACEKIETGKRWPRGSNVLMQRIREVEVDLKAFGISVTPEGRSNRGAIVRIAKICDGSDDCADGLPQVS